MEILLSHTGSGDNIGRDKIINIINFSHDYQSLVSDINDTEEALKYIPESEPDKRMHFSGKLNGLKDKLEKFKEDVFQLYKTFTEIPIDTYRLKCAKSHFDKGEFREADAILKSDIMVSDLNILIKREGQINDEKDIISKSRKQIANEFLIKAQLWKSFYSEPNWFDKTQEYFEKSLFASRNLETIFAYASFLQEHNKLNKAQELWEEGLPKMEALTLEIPNNLPGLATILFKLGNLFKEQNELLKAQRKYEESLKIYKKLSLINRDKYSHCIMKILNNQGEISSKKNNLKKAETMLTESFVGNGQSFLDRKFQTIGVIC